MSPERKEGINTCITNVILELLYSCMHWYMSNKTDLYLFTYHLLQGKLGYVKCRGKFTENLCCPAPRTALLEALPCGKQSAGGIFQVWLSLGVRKQKSPLRLGCALSTLHKARSLPLHTPRYMSVWRWAGKFQQGLPFFFSCCLAGNRSSLSKPLKYCSSQHMRIKKRKEQGCRPPDWNLMFWHYSALCLLFSQGLR